MNCSIPMRGRCRAPPSSGPRRLSRSCCSRPGNVVSQSVAPETRQEVREKLSRLIRSRWFEAPFGGLGFSRMLHDAFAAMQAAPVEVPAAAAGPSARSVCHRDRLQGPPRNAAPQQPAAGAGKRTPHFAELSQHWRPRLRESRWHRSTNWYLPRAPPRAFPVPFRRCRFPRLMRWRASTAKRGTRARRSSSV